MSSIEYAHRFAPCPVYDLEGMEHWLEKLALEGLFLSTSGFFGTYGTFEKREPKAVRYRMQPLQKKKYYEDDGLPHKAAWELAEEYGWSLICVVEDYAIYACDDPTAPELDTDPRIQALALRELYKKRRNGFLGSLAMMVFWFFRLWDRPMTLLTLLPVWLFLPALLSWCLTPFTGLTELFHLRGLCRNLSQGEPLTRSPRGKHILHRINTILAIIGVIWFPVIMVFSNFADWREYRWQPLDEYENTLPFSTMEEFMDGTIHPQRQVEIPQLRDDPIVFYEFSNHVAPRSTLLIPRQFALQQHGSVLSDGNPPIKGSLEVEYYEFQFEWMATQLYRELLNRKPREPYFETLELRELPTEQEAAYRGNGEVLLLQDGCKVLKAAFDQNEEYLVLELDQWAGTVAEAFLQ